MSEKLPHEMYRDEFAAWYREKQIDGFTAYLENLRAEIGGRTPRKIAETRMVYASEADRKLGEQIEELRNYEVQHPVGSDLSESLTTLDAKQLHAQRKGVIEDARRKGLKVSSEVLAEIEADDPWREFNDEQAKRHRRKR